MLNKSKSIYEKETLFFMQGINPHSECGFTNVQALKHKLEFTYDDDEDRLEWFLNKTDSAITPESIGLSEQEFEALHF